jgi:hypothetical protein
MAQWGWQSKRSLGAQRSASWSWNRGLGKNWPRNFTIGSTLITVVSCALPWAQMGARSRSSFTLLASVRRLDLLPLGPGRAFLAAWPAIPMLGALVIAGTLLGYRRVTAAAAFVLGLTTTVLAAVVESLPFPILIGTRIALWSGVGMLGLAVSTWRGNNDERMAATDSTG